MLKEIHKLSEQRIGKLYDVLENLIFEEANISFPENMKDYIICNYGFALLYNGFPELDIIRKLRKNKTSKIHNSMKLKRCLIVCCHARYLQYALAESLTEKERGFFIKLKKIFNEVKYER